MNREVEGGKTLLRALAGECVWPPPVWLMRQAGRYLPEYREVRSRVGGFLELCYTPELAEEVTLQPLRRFGFDAAILFSDILVVPDALGVDVRFLEGEGPKLVPVRTMDAILRLRPDRLAGHIEPVLETLRRLRVSLPPAVTLIGFSGAPWTLAAYMVEGGGSRDFAQARTLARTEPQLFTALVDILVDAVVDYLSRQVEAGAEALQLFDSWAGVLAPTELERWCVQPTRRIVEAMRARHPQVPVIAFPRGIGASYTIFAQQVPAAGLALDTTVPAAWAAAVLPGATVRCLQGNLDPLAMLGPLPTMLDEVDAILAAMRGTPFVFNLGHGIVPQTAPETVDALVRHLKSVAR